jgi:N-acetylmuramic acid 6-phosphate (MurNAc-6-P) etherase
VESGKDVKVAIVMGRLGLGRDAAVARLQSCNGLLGEALRVL